MTDANVARGPDTTDGPVGRWTVVSGKAEGVRPGFTVRDATGILWFIKFDAPGFSEQATGAEVVATKLFWTLGYNVAETHVATIRREDIVVSPDAIIKVHDKPRRFTADDVDRVLALVDRSSNGTYRALASKALEGKPVGEFLYYGTRADDPNDVVPHENRRELRAWACSLPGSTAWTRRPATPSTRSSPWTGRPLCAITPSTSDRLSEAAAPPQ